MKYLKWLGLISILILTISCDDASSDTDIDTAGIEAILYNIESTFNNMGDVDLIMQYYDLDYLHNGDSYNIAKQAWEIRQANYISMDITNLEIEIDGDYATASFVVYFTKTDGSEDIFVEPSENGDLSYWHEELSTWYVFGNRESVGVGTGYQLHISSDPSGAGIYVNNQPLYQYTPLILRNIPENVWPIRVYKPGYNEWSGLVSVPGTTFLNIGLSEPGYPRPVFDLDQPPDSSHVSEAPLAVAGIIRLHSASGQQQDFDGSEMVLSVNDIETVMDTNGVFNEMVQLRSGKNKIWLRATGSAGNTGVYGPIVVMGDF